MFRSEVNPKLSSSEEAVSLVSSSVSSTKFARAEARAFFFERFVEQSEAVAAIFERLVEQREAPETRLK